MTKQCANLYGKTAVQREREREKARTIAQLAAAALDVVVAAGTKTLIRFSY